MTIIEAVKSGKAFRRKDWIGARGWCVVKNHLIVYCDGLNSPIDMTDANILSDKWEIEEEKIEITREQLDRALDHCLHDQSFVPSFRSFIKMTAAKELGFK